MTAPKEIPVCPHSVRHTTSDQPCVTRYTAFVDLPQFLSVEEFRAFVGLGRSTVYDLLRREELPCVRFGRVVRIPKTALRRYVERNMHEKEEGNGEK